jgi:seryl-tRNA synthetase
LLSLQFIRENPDAVRQALANRRFEAPLDETLDLDRRRRALLTELEALKAERNRAGKEIGSAKDPAERQGLIEAMRADADRLDEMEKAASEIQARLDALLLEFPNMPADDVPIGAGEEENQVVAQHGEPPVLGFEPKAHWDLGVDLDVIDFDRGVKMSGSRFYVLKRDGARLQRAIIQWFLDLHGDQGYTEVKPPSVVRRESLVASGHLPKYEDNLYHDVEDDIWLVPTAESPLTNLFRDEILDPGTLPVRLVAYTPCFRREKMSAGRDVRGIKRGHEFDKVEMYVVCEPERSREELERMVEHAEECCRQLDIAHRVLKICTGDLGFAGTVQYDIEMWAPGQQEWLEVSSASDVGAFQGRRANIRFRREAGARPEFVHTLNASGLALPRTLIAVLENYQQADGSIVIPEVLRPYMRGQARIVPM